MATCPDCYGGDAYCPRCDGSGLVCGGCGEHPCICREAWDDDDPEAHTADDLGPYPDPGEDE